MAEASTGKLNVKLAEPLDRGAAYLLAWSQASAVACMVLCPDRRVAWINSAGVALLSTGDRLSRDGERLACVDVAQQPDLEAFLEEASVRPALWVYRDEEGGNLLLRGEPIDHPDGPSVGVFAHPVGLGSAPAWADLTKVFPLTRAEAGVVRRAVEGGRADAIAAELGVSLETVRTHFRRIYSKLGVSSREQLFALVTPYRLL